MTESRDYGSRYVMVIMWLIGSQATSPPNDSVMTRRGTIVRLFLMYGAASRTMILPLMTAVLLPIWRPMVVLPRTIVTLLVAGIHATVEPKVSAIKRIGTKVLPATISGAASMEVAWPSTVTMSLPIVRTMTLLTATGAVVIVTTPAALMVTATVVVRPEAYAETLPVSAAPYVMRPCAGETLETTATASVSVQAACVV